MFDVSGSRFEDRKRFERRLDDEDNETTRGGARVRPKNQLGAKKFGIEITMHIPGRGNDIVWKSWYRSERARQSGLDHFNRRENITPRQEGFHYSCSARVI